MADLSDVINAVSTAVTAALYPPASFPNGVAAGTPSPVANAIVAIGPGWPTAKTLDAVSATADATPPSANVSIFPRPGLYRNTSRFPAKWQKLSLSPATITAIVDTVTGTTITLGGTPGANQNLGALLGWSGGAAKQAFVYTTSTQDTLASAAAGLAALINAQTPASASSDVISIPSAHGLIARTGGTGTVIKELRRQTIRVDVNVWAPLPAVRDAIASPIRVAIDQTAFLTAASDSTALRIICANDHWMDDAEKDAMYRRLLAYDVEYPTTITMPATQILFGQSQLAISQTDAAASAQTTTY